MRAVFVQGDRADTGGHQHATQRQVDCGRKTPQVSLGSLLPSLSSVLLFLLPLFPSVFLSPLLFLSLFLLLFFFLFFPFSLSSILMTHTDFVTVTCLGIETGIVRGSDNEVV